MQHTTARRSLAQPSSAGNPQGPLPVRSEVQTPQHGAQGLSPLPPESPATVLLWLHHWHLPGRALSRFLSEGLLPPTGAPAPASHSQDTRPQPSREAHWHRAVFSPRTFPAPRRAQDAAPQSQSRASACLWRALLPVVGGQLAAPDVWYGGDPTALVLPVPNGAGHLQHTQDTPVPRTRGNTQTPPAGPRGRAVGQRERCGTQVTAAPSGL